MNYKTNKKGALITAVSLAMASFSGYGLAAGYGNDSKIGNSNMTSASDTIQATMR